MSGGLTNTTVDYENELLDKIKDVTIVNMFK